MTAVLSQDEIDQLLTAINAGDTDPEDFRPASDTRKIKIYDFKRPDRFTKEQIRSISIMHESFARDLTALLSAYFGKSVRVHVASVDQLTYEEFIRSIPTPTTIAVLHSETLNGKAIFEIDPAISHAMINRLFGGNGDQSKEQHELTTLEMNVMGDLIKHTVLAPLRDAWKKVIDTRLSLIKIDANPQFCQIVSPVEMTVLVTFECIFGEVEGMVNLCFPYTTITPVLPRLTAEYWYTGVEKKRVRTKEDTLSENIDRILIPVSVELGRKNLPIKDIKAIGEGTIIELDKLAGEPVDIYAGGEFIGRGEVVVIDENFGIRVVEVTGAQDV